MSEYWMQRLDAHMERGNAHMARSNELWERANELLDRNERAFDRNERAFERNTAAFERWERSQEEMREFMREITLRVERSGRDHSREVRRMGDEIVGELRAVRDALLRVLDRLEPGDSGSAA